MVSKKTCKYPIDTGDSYFIKYGNYDMQCLTGITNQTKMLFAEQLHKGLHGDEAILSTVSSYSMVK